MPPVARRILLVLDQPVLVELIKLTFAHGRYDVRGVSSAAEGLALMVHWRPHVVLFDVELEGVRDARIMDWVGPRDAGRAAIPTIALTRRGDLRSRLDAFDRGADDVLSIPFPPEELLARVVALVRRSYSEVPAFTPVIRLGELEIDILQRTVRVGTVDLHLTALEQSLLYLLAANAGRTVGRHEILQALWGADYLVGSNVVERQVRNLRVRLGDDWRHPRFIATVPGRGYRFLVSPAMTEPSPRIGQG